MRPDLSDWLVHFTKGETDEQAFMVLKKIIRDRCLIGGKGFIRGGHPCVCFSETPLSALNYGLTNRDGFSRYSQFGVLFSKRHIYALGGRPVIYQSDEEYELLPEQIRWRHVKLDLACDPVVDFSWEREWRLPLNKLSFIPADVSVILPNLSIMNRFESEIRDESYMDAYSWTQVLGDVAWLYDEGNPWSLQALDK